MQRFDDGDGVTYPEETHIVTAGRVGLKKLKLGGAVMLSLLKLLSLRRFWSLHGAMEARLRRSTPTELSIEAGQNSHPAGPGNSLEIPMRLVAEKLTGAFGQPFVIEAQPGAAGQIGTERVARSPRTAIHCSQPTTALSPCCRTFRSTLLRSRA